MWRSRLHRVGLVIGIASAAGLLFYVRWQLLGAVFWLTNRARGCTMEQAITSYSTRVQEAALTQHVMKVSKLLAESGGFQEWATPHGRFWVPKPSRGVLFETVGQQLRRIYEADPVRVTKGDIVLDCGAAYGVFTRTALQRGARTVVAIEPSPANVESLRRTFAQEIAAGKVILYPKGLWDRGGNLTLWTH